MKQIRIPRERALRRPIKKVDPKAKGKTDQSFADQCDINRIVAVFMKTGDEMMLKRRQGFYADFSYAPSDLLEAHRIIKEADEAFLDLPSHVRERFQNDPSQIVGFVQDPKNYEEAVELGLIPRKTEMVSTPTPTTLPTTPPKKTASKAPPAQTTTINDDE